MKSLPFVVFSTFAQFAGRGVKQRLIRRAKALLDLCALGCSPKFRVGFGSEFSGILVQK